MPRLWLLTGHPELDTPRRLAQAAAELGFEVETIAPDRFTRRDAAGARPEPRPSLRATSPLLLARPGTFNFVAILRAHRRCVQAGARALQERRALLDAGDQWRTLRRLRAAGVPMPVTRLVRSPSRLRAELTEVPGPPWFLKARRGSQGLHVLLARSEREAFEHGHLLWGTGHSPLVQEDRRPSGPVERHVVIGARVLASARAYPAPGEHRTNAHRGGRFEPLASRTRAAELALRAVAAVGLPFAAVDTIGTEDPVVLEVNASPGLTALSKATGRELARELVALVLMEQTERATGISAASPPTLRRHG